MTKSWLISSAVFLLSAITIHGWQHCGQPVVRAPLIKLGEDTNPGEWPWHSAIYHQDNNGVGSSASYSYKCGATLIRREFVLTAAHCVKLPSKAQVPNILVALGRYDLSLKHEENGVHRKVKQIIAHENFNRNSLENDIALLELDSPVTYGQYIIPICLWDQRMPDVVAGQLGTVVGWGLTETTAAGLTTLKKIKIPMMDPLKCLMHAREDFSHLIYDKMFCAGHKNGTGACNGDSGGGMYFYHEAQWFLRGIISFGKPLNNECDLQQYVGFTDVAGFEDWIDENTPIDEGLTLPQTFDYSRGSRYYPRQNKRIY